MQERDKKSQKIENNFQKKNKENSLNTITISIELPNEENNTIIRDEKLECLREAQKDALNTVNLVLHEITTSEKFTQTLKKSNKEDRHLQELFQEAKRVIEKCSENDFNKNNEGNNLFLEKYFYNLFII